MNRYCNSCDQLMVEYVGFNSRAGDKNNPYDCPSNCSQEKTPACSEGFDLRWPSDWDVTWVELKTKVTRVAEDFHTLGYKGLHVYVTGGIVLLADQCTDLFSWFTPDPVATPTQSTPAQSSLTARAKRASSQQPHTHTSPTVVHSSGVSVSTPWIPVQAPGVADQYSSLQQESDLPPLLGTPRKGPADEIADEIEIRMRYWANIHSPGRCGVLKV